MAAVTVQGHWVSDFWTHAATLAELIAHPADPADPLVGGDGGFPYYSPYLLVLAGLARLTGLGAVATLELAGLPVLVFALWAVRRFVAVFSPRRRTRAHRAFLRTKDPAERAAIADDYAVRWILVVPGFRDLGELAGWTSVATGPDGS